MTGLVLRGASDADAARGLEEVGRDIESCHFGLLILRGCKIGRLLNRD